jgi:hypothetical protein
MKISKILPKKLVTIPPMKWWEKNSINRYFLGKTIFSISGSYF